MRLSEKAAKLLDASAYRSAWRGVKRALHPLPVGRFMRRIDQPAIAALAARHENALLPGQNWTKYFDAERWLKLNIRRAQDIGIDREKRALRVLDLGSGAGYFLLVCRELGHSGIGLDVPEPAFYGEIFKQLGLERVEGRIEAREPLPERLLAGGKFDLATAFSIAFNGHKSANVWGPPEWDFLLNDLRDRFLLPGGRIYFDLNPEPDGSFMTPALCQFFLDRGAKIDRRSKLLFDPLRSTESENA
jgi:SAM-dependent methyltransferase